MLSRRLFNLLAIWSVLKRLYDFFRWHSRRPDLANRGDVEARYRQLYRSPVSSNETYPVSTVDDEPNFIDPDMHRKMLKQLIDKGKIRVPVNETANPVQIFPPALYERKGRA